VPITIVFVRHNRDRIISVFCHAAKGGQGMYNKVLSLVATARNFTLKTSPLYISFKSSFALVKLVSQCDIAFLTYLDHLCGITQMGSFLLVKASKGSVIMLLSQTYIQYRSVVAIYWRNRGYYGAKLCRWKQSSSTMAKLVRVVIR
jgi:hypothetical protein